jgi:hypothetical protein
MNLLDEVVVPIVVEGGTKPSIMFIDVFDVFE